MFATHKRMQLCVKLMAYRVGLLTVSTNNAASLISKRCGKYCQQKEISDARHDNNDKPFFGQS